MDTMLESKIIIFDSYESECPEHDLFDFKMNFKMFWEGELKDYGGILKGTMQMWYGKRLGHSKVCNSPQDLYYYVSNYDYIKIAVEYDEDNKQHLIFYLTHHDGTHTMELFSITKEGKDYLEENYGNINQAFINSEKFYEPICYIKTC